MNKWVLFSVFWLSHRFILAQGPATLEIINKGSDTVRYCSGTQLLSPLISITGSDFAADDGIKISLIDFRKGEDTIIYSGPSKLKVSWNNNSGDLEITGAGSAAEYQQVVRNVYYKNLLPVPVKGTRNISITLKDADYLPNWKLKSLTSSVRFNKPLLLMYPPMMSVPPVTADAVML